MQLILKAFLDIIFFKKGPDDIPKSSLLLAMVVGLAVAVNILFYAAVETDYESDQFLEFAIELVKIVSYLIVLLLFGVMSRATQTVTAIIACNAILGFLMTVVLILSQPLADMALDGVLAWLITIWLILVEGHIISRAIRLHWITGIAIAVVIFILQLGSFYYFGEVPDGTVG